MRHRCCRHRKGALIDLNETAVAEWNDKLRRLAEYWASHWAWNEDREPLVDDLVMAGWCAVLDFGPDHPRVLWEVQNGMQEALCLWMYGVGRRSNRWPRRISKRSSLDPSRDVPAPHSLETTVLQRVGLEQLWLQLTQGCDERKQTEYGTILSLLLDHWPATTIHAEGRQHRRQSGIGDRALLNGKRRIRRIAEALELRED